ncbi:MAG: hypothetical protein ACFFDP_04425 [Promethearchaeota archaeon]
MVGWDQIRRQKNLRVTCTFRSEQDCRHGLGILFFLLFLAMLVMCVPSMFFIIANASSHFYLFSGISVTLIPLIVTLLPSMLLLFVVIKPKVTLTPEDARVGSKHFPWNDLEYSIITKHHSKRGTYHVLQLRRPSKSWYKASILANDLPDLEVLTSMLEVLCS